MGSHISLFQSPDSVLAGLRVASRVLDLALILLGAVLSLLLFSGNAD